MSANRISALKLATAITLLPGAAASLSGQVLTPMELADPKTQHLQMRYFKTLTEIGGDIGAHKFPYPFYFSRTLDLDQSKMVEADQRSIRFDTYKNQTVLEVTGNYYAAYSADRMGPYERLKETFQQVVMPVLQAETPHFPDDSAFSAYAIEVSHHVRQKALGMTSEHPENVTVIIPVPVAQKLVDAKTDDQKQAAVLEAEVFLNGEPYSLWLREGPPPQEWTERYSPRLPATKTSAEPAVDTPGTGQSVSAALLKPASTPVRIVTPESLALVQAHNQDAIDRMTRALDKQAHFVPYAPPGFIGFRQGIYLQLSMTTSLDAPTTTSRYKLSALAFDDHVSHLVRSLLDYFPGDVDFDGVDFSTIVRVADSTKAEAVEFFFLIRMMRCFAAYDCTGQQLLDSGTVVMNGERAKLDLEIAEGKNRTHLARAPSIRRGPAPERSVCVLTSFQDLHNLTTSG